MDILGLISIPTWLLLILIIVMLLFIYSFHQHSRFRRLGYTGPRPVPFLGSLLPIMKKGMNQTVLDLVRDHGKIFGMYWGHLPTIWISDLDILKRIYIQDFPSFVNRENFTDLGEPFNLDLIRIEGDHWKYVRSVLSPTFSSGKLRQMFPLIERCTDILVQHVTDISKDGKSVELKRLFGGYTMDVISSTAFGIEVDSQKNPDDPFVKNASKLFDVSSFSNPVLVLPLIFPFTKPLMPRLPIKFFPKDLSDFFENVTRQALEERKKEGSNLKDFLQLMLNASKEQPSEKDIADDDEEEEEKAVIDFSHYKQRGLPEKEMVANAMLFFLAGYETTATTLMFTVYLLATNPDCQEKLLEEIDSRIGKRRTTYEDLQKLTYMDMVLSEALRIYPPVTFNTRSASADMTVDGYPIPAGMGIVIPVLAIHRDPKLWPEPMKFDPERFSAENVKTRHSMAHLPFGAGPRNCIGMRLAKIEAKMALVTLLQKFRFVRGPETEVPPKLDKNNIFLRPVNGIWVNVESRKL